MRRQLHTYPLLRWHAPLSYLATPRTSSDTQKLSSDSRTCVFVCAGYCRFFGSIYEAAISAYSDLLAVHAHVLGMPAQLPLHRGYGWYPCMPAHSSLAIS